MASEVQADFQKLWTNEQSFLKTLIPVLAKTKDLIATDVMFLRSVVVPPNNLRPLTKEGMPSVEHPSNKLYQSVLYSSAALKSVITAMTNKDKNVILAEDKNDILAEALKRIKGECRLVNISISF
ncbi:hypothetical protein WDU94_003770 [Cyamophila willieti]